MPRRQRSKSRRKTSKKSPRRRSRKRSSKKSPRRSRKISKSSMKCNKPRKSWRKGKKRVVKACSRGKEKLIHYGATGYGHNYSAAARKSFRARHRCSTAKNKLTARYWACKDLWTKGGSRKRCPSGRRCKK